MPDALDPTTSAGAAHIARLSRLALSADELAGMASHMTSMLEFVSALDGLETDGVDPSSVVDWGDAATVPARPDEPGACLPVDDALANAPARGAGGFLVPAILEE
jgi:aspartyl-tRNA(Asn)/glutamyl-tRNA(Gln) amidotransferase subunit C